MSSSPSSASNTLNPSQWVDLYGNYLFNYALGRVRNHTEAENLVQEAFVAAIKSVKSFEGKSTEKTWLTSILKHKIMDFYRKSYREQPVSNLQGQADRTNDLFDEQDKMKQAPSGWLPNPGELLEKKEFWAVFQGCQHKLPKAAGDAFTLKEMDKLDSKTICETLGITKSNYWVLMHRARLLLRQCLEENWFNPRNKL